MALAEGNVLHGASQHTLWFAKFDNKFLFFSTNILVLFLRDGA